MGQGIVFSDTHLFSTRSDAFSRMEEVYPLIRGCDLCVLNGDIFDFRWTLLSSLQETIERAAKWLEDLLKAYPQVRFFYIAGNHDAHPLFLSELDRIAAAHSNIQVVKYHLLIEDRLFLHGDTIHAHDRSLKALDAYRKLFAYTEKQSWMLDVFFRMLIVLRGPNVATALQNVGDHCKKISHYIELHFPEKKDQIRQVYYGHTHNPFEKYELDKVTFTNTGSMIRNLSYRVDRFEYTDLERGLMFA